MVSFKDISSSDGHLLEITSDKNDASKKKTTLFVHKAIIGKTSWPQLNPSPIIEWSVETPKSLGKSSKEWVLQSSLHMESSQSEKFMTLGRRIISGEVCWGRKLQLNGEFVYIPYYWEWLENILSRNEKVLRDAQVYDGVLASLYSYDRNMDVIRAFCEAWCPHTNSLHSSVGELSISLWDLHILGGLPILGTFYDEVVPSASELTGIDTQGKRLIPKTCEYLFSAFNYLYDEETQVSVDKWIEFWYRGNLKYKKPPLRKPKRPSRPRETHNPNGEITAPCVWTTKEKESFESLDVDPNLWDTTYLAAFLSCWLCVFVLPNEEVNLIRPSTFKIASLMATGRSFSLAIPVLASIYKGLNTISRSSHPGQSEACFPIHYVYGWLARYFETHFSTHDPLPGPSMVTFSGVGGAKYFDEHVARILIHLADNVKWDSTRFSRNRNEPYVDDGKLSCSSFNRFISIRSCYLTLRCNGSFIIEPYSPHRFGRQFGFCQGVPGILAKDIRFASFDRALKLWRISVRYKTMCKVLLPPRPLSFKMHVTQGYSDWWLSTHGNYLREGTDFLIKSVGPDHLKPKKDKKKKDKGDQLKILTPQKAPGQVLQDAVLTGKTKDVVKLSQKRSREEFEVPHTVAKGNAPQDSDDEKHSDKCWKHLKQKSGTGSSGNNHIKEPHQSNVAQLPQALIEKEKQDRLGTFHIPICSEFSIMGPRCFDQAAKDNNARGTFNVPINIQDDEEVTSHDKQQMPLPSIVSGGPACAPAESVFEVNKEIFKVRHQSSLMLGRRIISKLERLAFEEVPSFQKVADELCNEIDKIGVLDSSSLRECIQVYVRDVKGYLDLKHSLGQCMTLDIQSQHQDQIKLQLAAASSTKDVTIEDIKSLCINQQSFCSRKAELEKELALLTKKDQELEESISQKKIELTDKEKVVVSLEKELSEVKNACLVDDRELAALKRMEDLLKESRSDLKDLKWAD